MYLSSVLPTCKAGVSTCGHALSSICYVEWAILEPFVLGFFAHPVMLIVTILYCPSNPHLVIFLHLWAQAFILYIWFSSQYLFTPEGTMNQPAYPLSSQWESLNAMVTWDSLLVSLPWEVTCDLNTALSILEDSQGHFLFFSVKTGFFRVCCTLSFTHDSLCFLPWSVSECQAKHHWATTLAVSGFCFSILHQGECAHSKGTQAS